MTAMPQEYMQPRRLSLILSEGMNVSLLLFPDGDDPDSYCRKHSLEEVKSFMSENEMDFVTYLHTVGRDRLSDPVRRSSLINEIADAISCIPDAVRRSVFVDTASDKLGVSTEALFERISQTRLRMREEQAKAELREKRYRENIPETVRQAGEPVPQFENRTLERAERDLVKFLITHGQDPLEFESDSEYYSGTEDDKPTVSGFIRAAIDSDGSKMANSIYRKLYDEYFRLADAGLVQEEIIQKLLSSEDRGMADLTGQLAVEKYRLTIKNFEAAMTATSSWLVQYVPKSIIYYNERRIQDAIDKLRESMDTSSDQTELMKRIVKLQAAQRRVRQKLGRDKKVV